MKQKQANPKKSTTFTDVQAEIDRIAILHCPTCGKLRQRTESGWCCTEPHSRLVLYQVGDDRIMRNVRKYPEATVGEFLMYKIAGKPGHWLRCRSHAKRVATRIGGRKYWFRPAEKG